MGRAAHDWDGAVPLQRQTSNLMDWWKPACKVGEGCLDRRPVKSCEAGVWEVRGLHTEEPGKTVVGREARGHTPQGRSRAIREVRVVAGGRESEGF